MKTLTSLLTIIFSLLYLSSFSQWIHTNGPRSEEVLSIAVTDTAIYTGTWTKFYVSYNKGNNWLLLKDDVRPYAIYVCTDYILIGTSDHGVLKSTDGGQTWIDVNIGISYFQDSFYYGFYDRNDTLIMLNSRHMYYSTDEAATWVMANGADYLSPRDIIELNSNLYISTMSDGIYKSTDGGVNWNKLNSFPGIELCRLDTNSTVMLATADTLLYKSYDEGNTWEVINMGVFKTNFGALATVGSRIFIQTINFGIYYSDDMGLTWERKNHGMSSDYYFNSLIIDDNEIYASNSTGFYYSDNNGDYWESKLNDFMYFYYTENLRINNEKQYCISAGFMRSDDYGNSWVTKNSNIDSLNYLWGYELIRDTIFALFENNGVCFSNNYGESWEKRNNGLPNVEIKALAICSDTIVVSPEGHGFYMSTDYGLNWHSINNGFPDTAAYIYYGVLNSNDSCIYISYDDTMYSYAINGNYTWEETSFPYHFTSKVKDSIIFINKFNEGIYISKDYGNTWREYSNGIPYTSSNYLDIGYFETNGTDFFMATSENGVYMLVDSVWSPINNNLLNITLPNTHPTNIYLNGDTLYVAYYYQGYYKRSIENIQFNKYEGNVYSDINNNGIKDAGEVGIPNIIIRAINNNAYTTTDALGNYSIYTQSDDTIIVNDYTSYQDVIPENYIVTSSSSNLDFGIFGPLNINNNYSSDVSIYPNPTKGIITIEGEDIQQIIIYDIQGKIVLNKQKQSNIIITDISNYSKGIYFIKAICSNNIVVKKIIKQ